jgi:ferrous-iron efflux pump FieF
MSHAHHHHGPAHGLLAIGNETLRRQATMASLAVAATLIIAKLIAYFLTDSVSVLSSLLDSAMDFAASAVTAYGVAKAMRPPDHDHRYGHGKAEPLAAFAQASIIIGSSLLLGWQAILRLYHPRPLENEMAGYIVMGLAVVLTVGLVLFQQHVVRKTGSIAIGADRLHYVGDVAINIAVIIAFALHSLTGMQWFDPAFALAIVSALLVSAFQILKKSLHALMDSELPQEERVRILAIVERQPGVIGGHDMRTRTDGENIFIDLHVEMDGDISLRAAHELSERIVAAVVHEIPNADIMIHQDPAGLIEERRDTRIERNSRT